MKRARSRNKAIATKRSTPHSGYTHTRLGKYGQIQTASAKTGRTVNQGYKSEKQNVDIHQGD
jgi:hypothetical protein